ncbi:hypothetical protein CPAST_c07910 [Clostridium pasteurianum DSM 525 = ATCC 6013]|uniref:DUF2922 domain-containing protein n=1 Tax=Clostridium pasteurianum DSM 525 = ATCC 6013 TaxID=1262449 RepID=A0A0H3IZD8_CLOPA|nr:DUF2922 domain-containing protein [Clostridium pasteurianum]AJA46891.1 hypothetical protein CPAST_c07910 [Clostridium pasteurianum DSM 525 = ATCC 6013]AJA50879.1 hypothetical protein CLPA_c07910 [Clostridium pasteurianum DSM 525 = ATCC 6013]AOZ74274.1 hypothetical protein AQ983_03815 [Clostridium pasteurianum DSM 525 = ATCC 6013]AOZ78072.1 hypothetical protein AQ984_03820 [Clostridium pasteurianum]ELP58140.1 hypothetical protein F502_15600 [Clostridium pasteurianum DSM 525 = ATCC 6013]
MAHRLTLRFTTEEDGKYFSLSIDNVKQDENGQATVTEAEVNNLMDLIIQKKVFSTKTGELTGKKDAKIITTSSTDFDIS